MAVLAKCTAQDSLAGSVSGGRSQRWSTVSNVSGHTCKESMQLTDLSQRFPPM